MRADVHVDIAATKMQIANRSKDLRRKADRILAGEESRLRDLVIRYAPYDTGELEGGIYTDVELLSDGPVLIVGVRGVPHAVFVEYGTQDTPARPFIRPSVAEMPEHIKRAAR